MLWWTDGTPQDRMLCIFKGAFYGGMNKSDFQHNGSDGVWGDDFVCGAFNLAAIGEASYMYPKGYLCSGRKSGETTSRAMLLVCTVNSVCRCSALHGIELLMASRDQRSFIYMSSS